MHRLAITVLLLGGAGVASAAPATKLAFGTPTVGPGLAAPAVGTVVKRSMSQLLACYRKARAKEAIAQGTATARFTIGSDGKVTTATAVGLSMELETCIAATITKLRFAKPKGGAAVEVVYPLTYHSAELSGVFVSLTGTGDLSSGFGDPDTYGGLTATGSGPSLQGGYGAGGGGTGTIGLGRIGTTGAGYGVGIGMRGRPANRAGLVFGTPTVTGALDVAIIRRYLRRQAQQLHACYEKALLQQPTLHGTVTLAFTIGPDGRVTTATASGLGDAVVESCMSDIVKRMQLAKPKSGAVVVTVPLTLSLPPPAAPAPAP
ncbi:MAG: AgmX/PglI C-terminal domain-containing protein [Myxococcota bacterium]|nr:AgmX/PglI C-terminal domain-containing protein [Myxococcota bacterium]